jgi:hypothetical protein
MGEALFILSNLEAIDFGSKGFPYLNLHLKFFFLLAWHFFPSTKVVVLIVFESTAVPPIFLCLNLEKFSDNLVGPISPARSVCRGRSK